MTIVFVIPMKEGSSASDEAGFYGRHAKRQSTGVIALALTRGAEDFPLSFETTIGLVIPMKEGSSASDKRLLRAACQATKHGRDCTGVNAWRRRFLTIDNHSMSSR